MGRTRYALPRPPRGARDTHRKTLAAHHHARGRGYRSRPSRSVNADPPPRISSQCWCQRQSTHKGSRTETRPTSRRCGSVTWTATAIPHRRYRRESPVSTRARPTGKARWRGGLLQSPIVARHASAKDASRAVDHPRSDARPLRAALGHGWLDVASATALFPLDASAARRQKRALECRRAEPDAAQCGRGRHHEIFRFFLCDADQRIETMQSYFRATHSLAYARVDVANRVAHRAHVGLHRLRNAANIFSDMAHGMRRG